MGTRTIAFVRLGALGDVVRILPLAAAAKRKWQADRLIWVAGSAVAPLVRRVAAVDTVIEVPKLSAKTARNWLAVAARLRGERIDVCFDLQGLAKSGFLTAATRAPERRGLGPGRAREGSRFALTSRLERSERSRYEEALALLMLEWADWQRGAEELREAWGIRAEPRRGILLHPGTSARNRFRRWPATRYAEAAEQLARRTSQPIEVHAGPGERSLVEAVRRLANGTREALSGTLDELVTKIAGAAVFIGGDTGPLHLAVLTGTPAVAVYGPSDPETYALPPSVRARIVRLPLPCAPCNHRTCSTVECLAHLQADAVVEAAISLLDVARRPSV